jgi:osmotically-inducible protein OsmY
MIRTITKAAALVSILFVLSPAAFAASAPETVDLTNTFRAAGSTVDRLQVYEISGIVIIRGRAADKAQAEDLNRMATSLGYTRVANLVQIVQDRDDEITRKAEVELTVHRSLDGCRFHVTSEKGVVRVAGQVVHELQKDVAAQVLRNIDGVRSIEINLTRF